MSNNPTPYPDFQAYFNVLCNLLRAFGTVAKKPDAWAEDLIATWGRVLTNREIEDSELESPLLECVRNSIVFKMAKREYTGRPGTLYYCQPNELYTAFRKTINESFSDFKIPANPAGMTQRLRSTNKQFKLLKFLNKDLAPDMSELGRAGSARVCGIFVFDQDPEPGEDSPTDDEVTDPLKDE